MQLKFKVNFRALHVGGITAVEYFKNKETLMPACTPKLPSIVQLQVVRVTKQRIKKEQNHWPDSLLSAHELRG